MAIGTAWADGAWVDAAWVTGAWVQAGGAKTIGDTSQLGGMSSTGGIQVVEPKTIGATSQLEAFTSTGGLDVQTNHTIGAVSQLEAFSSTGFIQVGEVSSVNPPTGGGGVIRRGEIDAFRDRFKTQTDRVKLVREDEEILAITMALIEIGLI